MASRLLVLAWLFVLAAVVPVTAEKTVFYDQVTGCEIWRITNNPEAFYTHHYVEIPSIDATGRWVAFHERGNIWHVYVADLVTGRVKQVGNGIYPVWHPTKPALFYTRHGQQVRPAFMKAEPPDWRPKLVVDDTNRITSTSPDGRYGAFIKDNAIWRIRLKPGSKPELVMRAPDGVRFGGHMRYNPTKPWIFIIAKRKGQRWNGPSFVVRDDGSGARQFDILGEYIGHKCWAGDGSGMLRANTRWPLFKPFPLRADTPWLTMSRLQFWPNHIGCCGRDARLVTTDVSNQTLYITDTWTRHSHLLCVASGFSVAYSKDGDPHPHGSPDGTKVQFDSCYDLRDRGVTKLTRAIDAKTRTLAVTSTERFPDSGVLLIGQSEFVRYKRRDKTHFLECERGFPAPMYTSQYASPKSGARRHRVTRMITDYFGRFNTPGVRRGPQIFVAVVRDPQPPEKLTAKPAANGFQVAWQPPVLHYEIEAYRVERSRESGRGFAAIAKHVKGASFTDSSAKGPGPYFYRVISIERCGLESVPSSEAMATRSKQPPAVPRRLFIEAEACSIFGDSGPESSMRCYGRRYVRGENTWLTAPYRLPCKTTCVVWLRVNTHNRRSSALTVAACRAGVLWKRAALRACDGFVWQRVEKAPGKPFLFEAMAGDNAVELRFRARVDLDRVCVTDDLKFVPPDEPNVAPPAPKVRATAASPYEVKLKWPHVSAATLYDVRDAETGVLLGETQANTFVVKGMAPNSERKVRVRAFSRWAMPGKPSPAAVCRPRRMKLVRAETEAESCKLQAPMAVSNDAQASGGRFVQVPYRKSGKGALTFAFSTPVGGEFLIVGRTLGLWKAAKSLEVSVDGAKPLYISSAPHEWQWWPADTEPTKPQTKPSWPAVRLKAGKHTLTVTTDQDGLLLDKLLVTNDLAWRPESKETLTRRFVDLRPVATPGAETLLQPGKPGRFSINVSSRALRPLTCTVKLAHVPKGLSVTPAESSVKLEPRGQRVVMFSVKATQASARGHVRLLVEAEGQTQPVVLPVRALDRPIVLVQAEAEDAVKLLKNAKVIQSDEASGGRYVEYSDGGVVLEFDLPKEADYVVWARQFSPQQGFGHFANDGSKGFRIIGTWGDKLGRWSWLTSPRVPRHHWKAGKLRLTIKRRGDLFRRLDQVIVTDDPNFEPGW